MGCEEARSTCWPDNKAPPPCLWCIGPSPRLREELEKSGCPQAALQECTHPPGSVHSIPRREKTWEDRLQHPLRHSQHSPALWLRIWDVNRAKPQQRLEEA